MTKKYVLHFLTPLKNVSPFDVNMAADAGFDLVVPYIDVDLPEVTGLVQDAMFSRAPADAKKTAILIGGRDPVLALDMLDAARKATFPPFQPSIMADPSGAFTTAAGMIAVAANHLRGQGLEMTGRVVAVLGATGPVGGVAGLMAAQAGAKVKLVGYDGVSRVAARADAFGERFGVALTPFDGSTEEKKAAAIEDAEIILAAGRAGTQILSQAQIARATRLRVAIDVNAVPPPGLEGIGPMDDGVPIAGTEGVGFGALAVGNVKFKTEHALLQAMRDPDQPQVTGVAEALACARAHVG
jgi:methylene-tetrahydromethanopterin dehydrogenase